MPKLVFYRQKRFDGAIRTGIELDDVEIAHKFVDGAGDRDAALLWFVDLRCLGSGVPADPDAVAPWLVDHAEAIQDGFARFAEKLRVGADTDLYTLQWTEFDNLPPDVAMTIACSASRRVEARELASIVAEVGTHWRELLANELELVDVGSA